MDAKPKRRRYQFSLRTLLVIVTLAAPVFGWVGYSLNWIRERREILQSGSIVWWPPTKTAPGLLWVFGEKGYESLVTVSDSEQHTERLRQLFPEAAVESYLVKQDSLPASP